MMDSRIIPPSAFRQPPPPHGRRSDGSDSSMFIKQENTSVPQAKYLNSRTYYSRRCKKRNPTTIDSLPDELLFDILVRLPADFLYDEARLVCRKWFLIIQSQPFINTQIQHSTTYGLLLSSRLRSPVRPVYVTATQGRVEITELSYRCRAALSGSCNGLAVGRVGKNINETEYLHLINPTTKQPFILPSVDTYKRYVRAHFCGIAYSAASMEYKLTLPYYTFVDWGPLTEGLDILTVGVDKSWRNIAVGHLPQEFRRLLIWFPPVTTESFLHWGHFRRVLTLNVETEIFTVSQLPYPPTKYPTSYYYLSTGRNLSMLHHFGDYRWDIWEMEPGGSGEWRKVGTHKINLTKTLKKFKLLQQFTKLEPLGWVKYLEVLAFSYADRFCIFYNLETHEISTMKLPGFAPCRGLMHRNNLVWLS